MTFGEHDHECLADDGFHGESPVVRGQPQKAGMDLSVAQHLELFARPEELKREVDSRVTLPEDRQESREDVELGRGHVADDQLPDLPSRRSARDLRRAFRLRQGQPRFDQEGATRVRQLDPAVRSLEETDAELPLEATDLLTERRLRDVKALRGSTEVQLFRDGDEVPEVAKLHEWTIS
jgi:hypothetical protein